MDKQPPKPRKSMHSQIVQDLGMAIVSGRFKPEERLPMESTLCEQYQVSRSVLREATRVLSAKGLVYSSRGWARWYARGRNGTCSTRTCWPG